MPLFTWDKKYSVNNNELDEHHKTIFDIFNRLYDDCVGRHKPQSIDPLIEETISYTKYHFSAEEQHMKNIGYKDINKHIAEHREFTKRILQLQQVADADEQQTKKELIALLGDWLLHHIIKENKIYTV